MFYNTTTKSNNHEFPLILSITQNRTSFTLIMFIGRTFNQFTEQSPILMC